MKKTFLIMRQELITTFSRPSYLFFAFGFPVLAVLILGGVRLFQGRSSANSRADLAGPTEYQLETEGFVDHSGLIQTISEDLQDYLLPYESEAELNLRWRQAKFQPIT